MWYRGETSYDSTRVELRWIFWADSKIRVDFESPSSHYLVTFRVNFHSTRTVSFWKREVLVGHRHCVFCWRDNLKAKKFNNAFLAFESPPAKNYWLEIAEYRVFRVNSKFFIDLTRRIRVKGWLDSFLDDIPSLMWYVTERNRQV